MDSARARRDATTAPGGKATPGEQRPRAETISHQQREPPTDFAATRARASRAAAGKNGCADGKPPHAVLRTNRSLWQSVRAERWQRSCPRVETVSHPAA